MADHLLLPLPDNLTSRRVALGFGITPARNPRRHGTNLQGQLAGLMSPSAPVRTSDGVDPRLVFKIKSSSGFADEHILELRELEVLGHSSDETYFVLAGDGGLEFSRALAEYADSEDRDGASGPLKSLYNNIDLIEPYGRVDRTGPGLAELPTEGRVTIDVTLWPSESQDEASARMTLLALAVEESGGAIVAQTISRRFSLARCDVSAESLESLLDLYVIETIRTPPTPFVDPSDWRDLEASALEVSWSDGATIGVLDDLPADLHPIIGSHLTIEPPAMDLGRAWNSPGAHGSMVAGLALNSNYERDVRDGSVIHLQGKVIAIRVLEPVPEGMGEATRFPPEALPPVLVVDSIRRLHSAHGVRIFNLSFGYDKDYANSHIGEFSEMLDNLCRELDIVIVVAAGNATMPSNGVLDSGHHVADNYPDYLDLASNGLAQPANAATVLTVGGIASSDAPAEYNPPRLYRRAVAAVGHISPFSRTGPGHGKSSDRLNKPDLVAPAGNVVVDDTGMIDSRDQGTGVLSTALHSNGSLFQVGHGTSFAAPVVAADVAAVLEIYPDASANLLRALVASSATLPHGARVVTSETVRHSRYGFGVVTRADATSSGPHRVTMVFDGEMAVDTAVIHPIPMPREFALPKSSTRRIRIALAFDPPVRRTRREYTAATMTLDAYRGVELDALRAVLAQQDPQNRLPLFGGRRRVTDFRPTPTSLKESTLQVRDWMPKQMNLDDGDTYFIVVTHAARTWFRERDDYTNQKYALTVSLIDEARIELDLMQEVTQNVSVPARVRGRIRV